MGPTIPYLFYAETVSSKYYGCFLRQKRIFFSVHDISIPASEQLQ